MMELNIMSFNIRNQHANDGENGWEFRRDQVYALVRRRNPDVLGIQEAFSPQVEQMRAALPEYEAVSAGRDDGKAAGEHCTLFFRREQFDLLDQGTFWFSETPEIPGSRHWTPRHARICTWVRLRSGTGPAFAVYNVHLDHDSQFAREQSVRLLREHREQQKAMVPALVVGDFNMEEDNPAFGGFSEAGGHTLRDTFRVLYPEATACGTFHGFTGAVDGARIDFIFASPEFAIQSAEILHESQAGRYPSDHFPVLARVSLLG